MASPRVGAVVLLTLRCVTDLALLDGQKATFVKWLDAAIQAKPSLVEPYRRLVDFYLKEKDIAAALRTALLAQSNNPANVDVLDLLGATQIAAGKKSDALTTYNNLVSLLPRSPLAHE